MKNLKLIIILSLLLNTVISKAQVGIGTTTPNSSAKLDITSTNKGFLPPRVTLTGTTDVTTIASPATGLFVYNTATAGTSPSNVTPGLYYYDGSKWQRVINQQPDATVEFDKVTPTTSGVVFTPNTPASKDYVYVSTVDASQWTFNGSSYITYIPPASTAWYTSGGTTDAGSNKTGSIYRTGNVGIGTSTPSSTLTVGNATGTIAGEITLNPCNNQYEGGQIKLKKSITGSTKDWIIDQYGTTSENAGLRILTDSSEMIRIKENGFVGIGTTAPGAKLEVNSGVSNSSGMKFTNFNSSAPTSSGATLGVDANGNIVTVQGSSFSPSFGSSRISSTINLNAGSSSLLTSVTLPTTGTYLVTYTMRVQSTANNNNQYAVGYLSNVSTPGSPIVGTEILGAFSQSSASPFPITGGNYSGSYVVTTTSANKVIYFIGSANNGQMGFVDDQNGRTQISFVKVTP
jgi:hypothetical protein